MPEPPPNMWNNGFAARFKGLGLLFYLLLGGLGRGCVEVQDLNPKP